MASSWLNFFERKKWKKKNEKKLEKIEPATSRWAGERMWKLKNEPGWWRHTELAQGHVVGSIFSRCFFRFFGVVKKLSQLRGAEPLSQQRGNGESVLYGTDGFSNAALAVPTSQIID